MSFIIILIGTYSIGGFFDPVTAGISLKVGQSDGYRLHLVSGFGKGDKEIYTGEGREWKPFHWLNVEMRVEHYFPSKQWFQPYISAGVAYKDASEWVSYYEWEEDTSYYVLEEKKESYQSAVIGFGVEFNYFSELAEGVPFIENISFQIEFPTIYYKFKEEVVDHSEDYYSGRRERYSCGIGGGLGIHYNFK